jgi:hypothetical protein
MSKYILLILLFIQLSDAQVMRRRIGGFNQQVRTITCPSFADGGGDEAFTNPHNAETINGTDTDVSLAIGKTAILNGTFYIADSIGAGVTIDSFYVFVRGFSDVTVGITINVIVLYPFELTWTHVNDMEPGGDNYLGLSYSNHWTTSSLFAWDGSSAFSELLAGPVEMVYSFVSEADPARAYVDCIWLRVVYH